MKQKNKKNKRSSIYCFFLLISEDKCGKITPAEGRIRICVDGEIIDAGETTFEICPSVFKFVIPGRKDKKKEYV